ncbi:MAG: bacteriohemerythrin [Nitrospinota bacterium]|nr:bacteriohemerythrin [Nitrospinota bacterium]
MPVELGGKYILGVKTFDDQHIKLFQLIADLEKSVREGKSREMVGQVVENLLMYTLTHFSAEERLMLELGYSGYDTHLQEHSDLLSQVREFKNNYDAGKSVMTMELMGFLVNWLTNHIDRTDRQYVGLFKGKGIE